MDKTIAKIKNGIDYSKVRMVLSGIIIFAGLLLAADEAPALNITALAMEKLAAVVVIAIGAIMCPRNEKGGSR